MIKIQLVVVNGRLVGRTFSDRWNLDQLGFGWPKYQRNHAWIKKFRRFHESEGFTFSLVRGTAIAISEQERLAFNRPVSSNRAA